VIEFPQYHPLDPETAFRNLLDWEKQLNTDINRIRYNIERTIANLQTWRPLHTNYRRPLETFATTITAVLGLEFSRTVGE